MGGKHHSCLSRKTKLEKICIRVFFQPAATLGKRFGLGAVPGSAGKREKSWGGEMEN
jgi:hypothetical protein